MRILIVAVVLLGGCRDRVAVNEDPVEMRKTVEADDDFLQTRASTQTQARARLAQIDHRIEELGDDASVHLHAQRETIELRIEEMSEQSETAFDTFRAELDKSFNELERQLTRQ